MKNSMNILLRLEQAVMSGVALFFLAQHILNLPL